jgi:hypothetical protein
MRWSSRKLSPIPPPHLPISKLDNSGDVCTIKLNEEKNSDKYMERRFH